MEALRSVSLELYRILSQVGSYLAPPLQELSYDTNIPALLALIYGTLGSVAPCQMSANAGAIAYLTNRAGTERRWIWRDTTAYLLGKEVVYTVLGVFAITLGLQLPTGAMVVLRKLFGPLMILLSLQFLGVLRLRLPLGGALSEWLQRHLPGRGDGGAFLLGATYSLAFCPTMALLFFGWLVPLGIRAPGPGGLVLPAIFAVGTAYRRDELVALAQRCRDNRLYLYLDGARLGSALVSAESDLTLPDLGRLVDVFYVGGTKNGALIGEAIIINTPALQGDFRFHLKQRGALLAKGRLLGIQFVGLFTDDLYFELARHANAMAGKLAGGLAAQGFRFLTNSTTNQIFPILPDALIAELQRSYGFYVWSKVDAGHSAIRLVTSWATPEEKVAEFVEDVRVARVS